MSFGTKELRILAPRANTLGPPLLSGDNLNSSKNPENLEIQKIQDGAQHSIRRPHPVRDHALALDLQFQIADRIRSDHVVRSDIAPADHSAQDDRLFLMVHVDDAF